MVRIYADPRRVERGRSLGSDTILVDDFNALHPPGTKVRIWSGIRGEGDAIETVVEAPGAFLLGGHTPVIKVPGDAVAMTHVELL